MISISHNCEQCVTLCFFAKNLLISENDCQYPHTRAGSRLFRINNSSIYKYVYKSKNLPFIGRFSYYSEYKMLAFKM